MRIYFEGIAIGLGEAFYLVKDVMRIAQIEGFVTGRQELGLRHRSLIVKYANLIDLSGYGLVFDTIAR